MRNAALAVGACLTGGALGYAFRPPAMDELVLFILIAAIVFGVLSYLATEEKKG